MIPTKLKNTSIANLGVASFIAIIIAIGREGEGRERRGKGEEEVGRVRRRRGKGKEQGGRALLKCP